MSGKSFEFSSNAGRGRGAFDYHWMQRQPIAEGAGWTTCG